MMSPVSTTYERYLPQFRIPEKELLAMLNLNGRGLDRRVERHGRYESVKLLCFGIKIAEYIRFIGISCAYHKIPAGMNYCSLVELCRVVPNFKDNYNLNTRQILDFHYSEMKFILGNEDGPADLWGSMVVRQRKGIEEFIRHLELSLLACRLNHITKITPKVWHLMRDVLMRPWYAARVLRRLIDHSQPLPHSSPNTSTEFN
jgi:hypothetical protein